MTSGGMPLTLRITAEKAAPSVLKRQPFVIKPLNQKRVSLVRLRSRLAKTLAHFFRLQAPHIADQINTKRAQYAKAALSQEEQDAVEETLAAIDFSGWAVLVGDVQNIMQEIAKDGSVAALAQIHFDTETSPGVINVVNEDAVRYAQDRAAEMVGMRRLASGTLVDNPDATWAITDSTRDGLRQYVVDAISEGWSNDKLAGAIVDSYQMSTDRAMVIARTETSLASNGGSLNGYKASGVVDGKEWLTADDDDVDEEMCAPNQDEGPIALDDVFQSGDDAPPAHPNCRCVISPVIDWAKE